MAHILPRPEPSVSDLTDAVKDIEDEGGSRAFAWMGVAPDGPLKDVDGSDSDGEEAGVPLSPYEKGSACITCDPSLLIASFTAPRWVFWIDLPRTFKRERSTRQGRNELFLWAIFCQHVKKSNFGDTCENTARLKAFVFAPW